MRLDGRSAYCSLSLNLIVSLFFSSTVYAVMPAGRGIGYKVFENVSRVSQHDYLDSKKATGYAIWTIQDVIVLITFLKAHVPGNGHKFKAPVLNAAAAHLNQHLIKGGAKKPKGIKDKVRDVCLVFCAVFCVY